jgi:hypothetical protein
MVRTVSASSGIEIGCRLAACKAELGHGNWLPWLDREFGWSDRTALNFMRVYEMVTKSEKFSDLSLPVSSLYLLAAPSTPEEARQAVIESSSARRSSVCCHGLIASTGRHGSASIPSLNRREPF